MSSVFSITLCLLSCCPAPTEEFDEAMRCSLSASLPESACVFGDVLQIFQDAHEASEVIRSRATLRESRLCSGSTACEL